MILEIACCCCLIKQQQGTAMFDLEVTLFVAISQHLPRLLLSEV